MSFNMWSIESIFEIAIQNSDHGFRIGLKIQTQKSRFYEFMRRRRVSLNEVQFG